MARIHVLDKKTAELIAAGEVIERPSSVVKELVENAIDAGATSITVEIQNGGIRYIRVTDNGCGILREDVPRAFLRHATSKVAREEDLYRIGTLGFRGEALASIAAVAHVELLTKAAEETLGTRYAIDGGDPGKAEEAGCPTGTTILVKDLFYNLPARMKFLKKDVTEGNAIAALLDRLALSHPEVSFKLIREGQLKLHTPGDGQLLSAIYAVYGADFGGGLIPVESSQGGVAVSGYITKPEKSKGSRSMEHFFINGRYVRSVTMLSALEEAYRNSIMSGKFPGCVLNVALPYGMVDVNVHPAKLEVKLSDERVLFDGVYNACKGALERMDNTVRATDASKTYAGRTKVFFASGREAGPAAGGSENGLARMSFREYRELGEEGQKEKKALPNFYGGGQRTLRMPQKEAGKGTDSGRREASKETAQSNLGLPMALANDGLEKLYAASLPSRPKAPFSHGCPVSGAGGGEKPYLGQMAGESPDPLPKQPVGETAGRQPAQAEVHPDGVPQDSVGISVAPQDPQLRIAGMESKPVRLIGEVCHTFLLAERGEELLLVDKHAAHERILFEKLKAAHASGEADRQVLLAPIRVSLPKDRYDAILQNLSLLKQVGFEVEDFGDGSLLVREIPAILDMGQVENMMEEMAEMVIKGYSRLELGIFDELYHSIACKAAVKGGNFTGEEEARELVEFLQNDKAIRNCPHGRPVMIAMKKRELEKMFGRIV